MIIIFMTGDNNHDFLLQVSRTLQSEANKKIQQA